MYPVSELFKSKIQENNRTFKAIIEIQHSQGVLFLYDGDLVGGTLLFTESSQSGEDFTIGGTVASDIAFLMLNKPEYSSIEFMGATVFVTIGLEVVPGMGVTYEDLKRYTYDELRQFTYGQIAGEYEYVPLGKFHIDDVNKQRNTIGIKAIDNMIELDKRYSLSKLGYPATLKQIYVDVCNMCDIQVGTTNFPNMNYVVQEKPTEELTFRDVIGYVAELSGTFARMNRTGALELTWYKPSNITLTGANRFNFKASDNTVQIKGIMATVDDTTYLAGTDEYAIDLSDNPLLQGGYETVLPNIFNNVKDTVFTPYESSWQGNPAIQAGDLITQIDRDGNVYNTLITSSTYKYRGASSLSAKGLPLISKGYKGSTNKKIANIMRKVEKEVGDKLTTLEQAQLNATQLIANMLGGYAIIEGDSFYVADNQNLSLAQKVWKWGIGGFGYSDNGVNGPYTTAITADGSIVAMLVAANIITADMVNTGLLRSVSGNLIMDLDNSLLTVYDDLRNVRLKLGKYDLDKFGLLLKDPKNNQTILSEEGLLSTLQENLLDNFDSNHPAKLKFYIPSNAGNIADLKLSFSLEKFRGYVNTLAMYGSTTANTSLIEDIMGRTTSSDGNHTHTISEYWGGGYVASTNGSHSHKFGIGHAHTVDISHQHTIKYGIYEGTAPNNVGIKINDIDKTSVLGGPWDGEISIAEIDIAPYINGSGWHTIEFFMPENAENPVIGRISANIFGMVFMYAPN